MASRTLDVPVAGLTYRVWEARYGDWREATERFQVRIDAQAEGAVPTWTPTYGAKGGGRRGRQRDEALLRLGLRLGDQVGRGQL